MKRPTLYALAWLVFTLGVLLFHSGCSKQIPNCPTPTSEYKGGWCTGGVRDGKDFLFCTPSRSLCQYAVDRANAFNGVAKLGIETLSECKQSNVALTAQGAPGK